MSSSSKKESSNSFRNIALIIGAFLIIGMLMPSGPMQMFTGSSTDGMDEITIVNSGNLGTLIDSVELKSSTGGNDIAIGSFDGVDDYVSTSCTMDMSEPLSMSFWVKRNENFDAVEVVFDNLDDYNTAAVVAIKTRYTDEMWFRYGSDGDGHAKKAILHNINEWYHVVWTHNPDASSVTYSVYQDAALVDTVIWLEDAVSGTHDLTIGTVGWSPKLDFYDMRVYDRILTQSEVSSLYNQNADVTTGLIGQWFDGSDTSGTAVHDQSGNNNDGTLIGDTGTNFWATDSSSPFRVDMTNFGITLGDNKYAYSGTLDRFDTLVCDEGEAHIGVTDVTGSMTGSLGIIPPGDSLDVTVDEGMEYEIEYTPYDMDIEIDTDLASGDSVVINTKLTAVGGQVVSDQPDAMRIRLTGPYGLMLDKEVNSMDYVIPAEYMEDGGHRQARLSYNDARFGGWSTEIAIDWDIGIDGYVQSTDAEAAPNEFSDSVVVQITDMLTKILSNWANSGVPIISEISASLVVALG